VLAAVLAAAPAPAATIGIADQKPDMFQDARFRAAGVPIARKQVGWDVMSHGWQVAELDAWLRAAREAGVRPLLSFGHSREHRRTLPRPERLRHELRRIRDRWPWVREFATWNEANHCGQPTCNRPRLVAAYWRALRKECGGRCRVLAAELLDMPNMERWTREFLRHADIEPRLWGLHNYVDANRFRTNSTRTLLRLVRGRIWLTETGGLVARHGKRRETVDLKESKWHALRVTRFLLRDVRRLSPRIQRIYLYHWNAQPKRRASWDSGLFDGEGRPRPAWRLVREELHRERAARARRAQARR
jgi:hypothetical protein